MPNVWTLTGETGKAMSPSPRTFQELNAHGGRVTFRNLATDTLTFSIPIYNLASTAEIIPELGQVVGLQRSGTQIFQGHVTGRRQTGRVITITVSGPWWWLERIFLESSQVDGMGDTAPRPTYVFPGQSLTTSLQNIVNKAIALGVPMALGNLAATFASPPMRVNQTSYAGTIADLVRVTPDMVLAFNYAGSVPTLNTARRLYAPGLTLDARQLGGFELNPITELEVTQVQVPYMTRSTSGKRQFNTQIAGTHSVGKVYIHIVSGTEMDTFLPPDIIKTTVTPPSAVTKVKFKADFAPGNFQYVAQTYDPVISQAYRNYKQYTIGSYQFQGQWVGNYGTPYLLAEGPPTTAKNAAGNNANLVNKFILLSTSLPDWAATQLKAERVTYSGTWYHYGTEWRYATPAPPLSPVEALLAPGGEVVIGWVVKPTPGVDVNLLPNLNVKVRRFIKRSWSASVTVVNRPSGTITKSNPGQPTVTTAADYIFRYPPAGYAAGLLAAQNYIPYEGRFTVVEDEAGGTRYMMSALNFSDSQPAYASIRAMVSEEEIDIGSGKTTVRLGPPARFSYRELVNRVKTNANDQIIYL